MLFLLPMYGHCGTGAVVAVGSRVGFAVGGTGVLVGGIMVGVGGTGVLVGGAAVGIGGTSILVGGIAVSVDGCRVLVGGIWVAVGRRAVLVGAALVAVAGMALSGARVGVPVGVAPPQADKASDTIKRTRVLLTPHPHPRPLGAPMTTKKPVHRIAVNGLPRCVVWITAL